MQSKQGMRHSTSRLIAKWEKLFQKFGQESKRISVILLGNEPRRALKSYTFGEFPSSLKRAPRRYAERVSQNSSFLLKILEFLLPFSGSEKEPTHDTLSDKTNFIGQTVCFNTFIFIFLLFGWLILKTFLPFYFSRDFFSNKQKAIIWWKYKIALTLEYFDAKKSFSLHVSCRILN